MNAFSIINKAGQKYARGLLIAGLALFAMIMFWEVLSPARCLLTTDDNLGMIPSLKGIMPHGIFGYWNDAILMGSSGGRVPIMWTPFFLWLTPVWFGFNWIHALDLLLASIFLAMFLRSAGLPWIAVVMGLLTAFWVGSNLTLTYAGHLGKFAGLMFAAASLYGIRKTFESDRPWLWSIVTGGFVGFMFLEQQDVAFFFGLFLGAYALFRALILFRNDGRFKGLLLLIPMAAMILIISGATLMASYAQNVSSVAVEQEDNSRQKWEFTTQWSWPPEESIDFVAPGYMGWRSSEPEGPYWGRMGRSAGWEKTGQGFMNFKLENHYLGAIPIVFAIFAVFMVLLSSKFRRLDSGSCETNLANHENIDWDNIKLEVYFWFFAAVLALLLSFGKYFPLYELFYQLPVVSNIRNPNKFFHIFQIAVGILAAYGAYLLFIWRPVNENPIRREQ